MWEPPGFNIFFFVLFPTDSRYCIELHLQLNFENNETQRKNFIDKLAQFVNIS